MLLEKEADSPIHPQTLRMAGQASFDFLFIFNFFCVFPTGALPANSHRESNLFAALQQETESVFLLQSIM